MGSPLRYWLASLKWYGGEGTDGGGGEAERRRRTFLGPWWDELLDDPERADCVALSLGGDVDPERDMSERGCGVEEFLVDDVEAR
jgi:hypothetical protein